MTSTQGHQRKAKVGRTLWSPNLSALVDTEKQTQGRLEEAQQKECERQ